MHRSTASAVDPLVSEFTPSRASAPGARSPEVDERVVLLDPAGAPCATMPKTAAHGHDTQLHLALSCYVVDAAGNVLLTRRAPQKRTWPGVWTNSCCGHPLPGESIRAAAVRRVAQELGLRVRRVSLVFPDFAYRAVMHDGTVENELCPVVVAEADGEPVLDPAEVAAARWVSWPEFLARAEIAGALSPWSVAQARRFVEAGAPPAAWLHGRAPHRQPTSRLCWPDLDAPASVPDQLARDADVTAGVDRALRGFLAERSAELIAMDERATPLHAAVEQLVLSGGKRLRPSFVYWGHRATGADHDDAVLSVGAAVELLHTFALVHDDVMDRSETRRGAPSAHVALAEHHRTSGGVGDSAWFGSSAAVVAGDLAHVWAQQLFDEASLSTEARRRARAVFTMLQTEVMAGQYLDLRLAGRPVDDASAAHDALDDARRVALLKSGRYTVTRPLQLGAAVAGVDPGLDAALTEYGDALGVAFQLRDDVLGLMGDPARTGKSSSDDLREGKRTVLVLRTLARAGASGRELLADALGNPDLDDATCDRVRELTVESGALAEIEAEIAALTAVAVAAACRLPAPARQELLALAPRLTQRER